MNINVYFLGTAGSGKSSLTYAFQSWMSKNGFDCITINLDPGAEDPLYSPDIDIREWIVLSDVMAQYKLGPNGAQIACADMLAFYAPQVKEIIDGFETNYILIDTPGQMELFNFRESSKVVVDKFGAENSIFIQLFDPMLSKTPSGFVSQLMLAATTQFRFPVPSLNVLSKADIIEEREIEQIIRWSEDYNALYGDMLGQDTDMHTKLSIELFKALEDIGTFKSLIPASSETGMGMEDLYNTIQQIFAGGEDLSAD